MYSVRKTRTLSICLLMVLSTLGPLAVPAAADHEEEDWPYFDLLIDEDYDGTWELLEPNTMFEVEAGTYDMQIDYYNLDVGSNYTLMWNTYGIHEDGGGMEGNVSSENVTDTWQMEVSEFDCWYQAVVEIINTTDGVWEYVDHRDYDFHGECMEYGTVTPSAEINGTWVSEPDELEPGTYQMSWDVTNLTTGGEYKLDYWYYLTGNTWDMDRNITEYAWDATGSEENIGWNVTVTEFDCTLQPEALLWQNTTTGWTIIDQYWVGSWSEVISLPCESMMTAYIWLDEEGDWVELANRNSADYWSHHFPNDNTCEEFWDLDGDGNEDHWWECTDPDTGDVEEFDECFEYYNEQTDEDMLECFINYESMYLEEGVYNVTLEIVGLSVGEEYFLHGELWESGVWDYESNYYELGFTAPTEEVSEVVYLVVSAETCSTGFDLALSHNETVDGMDHSEQLESMSVSVDGPCEQPPSPFTLYYDGMEHEQVTHYTEYDVCDEYEDGYFECWMDDWDEDGDGEPEWTDWRDDCEEDSNGTWWCVDWHEDPHIDAGNHTMTWNVSDLEEDVEYEVEWAVQINQNMGGWDYYNTEFYAFNATGNTQSQDVYELIDWYLETDNFTCNVNIQIELYENESDGSGNWHFNRVGWDHFNFKGPCEQPPSPFTLYYDGMEYERVANNMTGFDGCDEYDDGYFECYIDYDGDGNWDDWYGFEECSNLSTGWECVEWYEDPFVEEGNHTGWLDVEGLEADGSYMLEWYDQRCTQQGCEGMSGDWGGPFNVSDLWDYDSADGIWTHDGYYFNTNNYTCSYSSEFWLYEVQWDDQGNWWPGDQIFAEWFGFNGPCEEPPSPFTLYYDGMEYEQVANNMTGFDGCDEDDDEYFECWIGYDWDGDGEPDDYEYWGFEECSNLSTGWECVEWYEDPFINEGNHSMTLEVEDLETGLNYSVSIQININTQQGGEYEEGYEDFTASSDTYSTSGHIETDNFTCNLNIHVSLNENESDGSGNWWHHQIAYDWFNFRGPCEQPPSPFTLYYDGIEYEQIIHYNEYDQCEDDTGGSGIEQYRCWDDDWDGDGDGEPDYWNYQYNCEEDANGTWWCEGWHQNPYIDAGNHSMTLEVLDLEAGTSYAVMYNTDVCTSMMGCEWDSFEELFNASSDVESLSFFLETDNSTCNANIHATLYEVSWDEDGNWWHDRHLFGESFGFDGPCEQPPSPIHLIYTDENGDEVEWEPEMESHEYDECDDYGDHFECWYNDEGDEMIWEDDCEQNSNGTWLCESLGGSPDIAEGDHNMMWNVTDLEDGKNYSLMWTVYSMSMMGYDMDEGQENFTASSDAHDIDWSLHVDNSTCNVIINAQLAQPVDYDEDGIVDWYDYVAYTGFNFNGPCEMSLPVDIGLEIEDGGAWFDVEGVPLEVIFCEDCDYDEGDEMGLILQYVGYNLTAAGEYDLRWTLSGLTVGENYTFEYGPEGPGDSDGDVYWDIYSYCEWEGTDEGDERWWCTDDGDGSDGFDDWWFYCEYDAEDDQWWCTDDFGQNPDWEFSADGTEHEGADGAQGQGDEYEWTAASETEEISWAIGIGNDTCVLMIQGQAYSSNEWGDEMFAGMFIGVITGPAFAHDDNGNGMPDCMEMGPGPGPGPDGPHMGSEMGHLALGLDDGMGDFMEPFPYQHLDVGTYDMAFAAMGLEEDEGYVLSLRVGMDGELIEEVVNISTDNDGWTQHNFSITLTDWDCFIIVEGYLETEESDYVDSFLMILEGPCMGGSLEGLISAEAIDENGMSHALTNDEGYREFLDHGAYEVVVEISGLTVGTDYTVGHAYLEGVWGVADVIAQLWDTEGPEGEWNFTASSSNESFSLWIEIHDYTCGAFLLLEIFEPQEDTGSGESHDLAYAFIGTPCGDGEGGFDIWDFVTGQEFGAFLAEVDGANGTAIVVLDNLQFLHEEVRMKIDHDFGDGDGWLNESEAMMFEGMSEFPGGDGECVDEETADYAPEFTMNGVDWWCAELNIWYEGLANGSGMEPAIVIAWDLHFNASADSAGELVMVFPGDDPEEDGPLEYDSTFCTDADMVAEYQVISWTYNGTTIPVESQEQVCFEIAAGEHVSAMEIVFGTVDSDGDGYNDHDDRFPDDPNEWADTDDDGVGDNADDFPEDASEQNDADGDGVGDNSDDFPWDPSESADTDGDGYGDNGDAFPNDDTEWVDTDADGTGDNADTDADGDGIDDDAEDSDGDGVYDDQDAFPFDANETADSDGDGVGDNGDAFPDDANETTDTDGDGIGDNSDDDADGDGQPNDVDDFPLNSGESADADGDGVGDNEDMFPNDSSEYIDSDGDGTGDNADPDDDNDGTPDASDDFPLDGTESADTDGDGVGDNADVFPNDPYERHDSDGDGVGDNTDSFPSNPSEWSDADNDGTGDNTDSFPNDPNEIVDSDGDGVGNNADAFPFDNTETADSDGDGVGDNAQAANEGQEPEVIEPEPDDGGLLPGFSATMSLVSMLGAAILIAGRRKD